LIPATELVAMIDPPPLVIRCGTAATMVFHTPVRLVSSVSFQISGLTSSQAWTVQIPALALTMSSRPRRATPSSTAAPRDSASRTSTRLATMRRPRASTSATVSQRSSEPAIGYGTDG
jgi:hypothetical protein